MQEKYKNKARNWIFNCHANQWINTEKLQIIIICNNREVCLEQFFFPLCLFFWGGGDFYFISDAFHRFCDQNEPQLTGMSSDPSQSVYLN